MPINVSYGLMLEILVIIFLLLFLFIRILFFYVHKLYIFAGSNNDAGIFANSDLGVALANREIHLPGEQFLPGTRTICPNFLIGDGGFPLKEYLMKPFLRNENLTVPQQVYNFRLSHARIIIENAFGELSMTWLVNESVLPWKLSTNENVIMSTVCLHNFLIDIKRNERDRWNRIDNNVNNVGVEHERNQLNNLEAFRIRERLSNYFSSPEGSVPWQWDRI